MLPPPQAPRRATTRSLHGNTSTDDYAWLRERDNPEVRSYLEAENDYAEAATAHLSELRERIFQEIKSKVQETDLSAPARLGEWWYGRRSEEGKQYPVFLRWHQSPEGEEQVVLDQNQLAEGQDYCALGVFQVTVDQSMLAYSVDHSGNEDYTLRFRHIDRHTDRPDSLTGTYYGGAWSSDGAFFFYCTLDHAHRPHRLWRHRLGTEQSEDVLVFEEEDERFFLSAAPSRDHRYVLIEVVSSTTSETAFIPTDRPEDPPEVLIPRQPGVRYQAEHRRGQWLIVTDENAPNGELVTYPVDDLSPRARQVLIAHDPLVKVARVLPFARHLVVKGRKEGLPAVTVIPDSGEPFDLEFHE
ncbi:MAG TPA: oligopeptidase B, partial [Acidimicrobiia bacterium]|nr:oligopeptidase B [Acidimicrobiia bacterium]